jgi:hypothetical protein
MTLLNAGVVDTFNLVDNPAHVVEDIIAVSPWRRLRGTDRWGDRWRCYLRTWALDKYPLLQVWPSQQAAIDTGLLRAPRSNLLITMPTSACKANIAEWAILDAVGGTKKQVRCLHCPDPFPGQRSRSDPIALAGPAQTHRLGNVRRP